ncbi:MAG TPA: protein kinase [Ktedonobacterales bacterium]
MKDELLGTRIGHCIIREPLGQGGMARVYKGFQEHLDRWVAIKVLPPYYAADPNFVNRFKLEAQAMARLTHPNIITVHDAGEQDGRLYIVMAYMSRGTLKDQMARSMEASRALPIIRQVAEALNYAHERSIIHRDVKPVNVLFDDDGRAVLSDFGIAKIMESAEHRLTRPGAGVGTPEYMSPEQCRGDPVSSRADVYALGITLYEMLTGRTPFQADNYTALAHAHIYEPVPPPTLFNSRISPAVEAVIMRALAKEPAHRFIRATDFSQALERAISGGELPGESLVDGGGPRGAVLVCPRCQATNGANLRFCSKCGISLVGVEPRQPSAAMLGRVSQTRSGTWAQRCRNCQGLNATISKFCTKCGMALDGEMILATLACAKCGHHNLLTRNFCTRCGTRLAR